MLDGIRNSAQSWGVKIIFGVIILVFVFWGVGNLGGMPSGSLAVVNGDNISLRDYDKSLRIAATGETRRDPEVLSDENKFRQLKQLVLEEMIVSRLMIQEAARLGLMVTPHELKVRIASFPVFQDSQGAFDQELYQRLLAAQDLSPGEFEQEVRNEMLQDKLMAYIRLSGDVSEGEVEKLFTFTMEKRFAEYVLFKPVDHRATVEVSDADIEAYYDAFKEAFRLPVRADVQYVLLTPQALSKNYPVPDDEARAYYAENQERFHSPDSFESRHIFIPAPPEGSTEPGAAEALAEAQKAVEEIGGKLQSGGDFPELAREYSRDGDSADLGGMLGWLQVGQSGSREFDEQAMSMNPGETSGPVRTPYGFHFIRLENKRAAATRPFEEVKDVILNELSLKLADVDFERLEREAEDGLAVGTPLAELAAKFNLTVSETGLQPQEAVESSLNLHSDSRQMFLDAVASAAAGGEGATIPVPLNVRDGVALVRVVSARPSEIPSLADVRESAIGVLKEEKAQAAARSAAEAALASFTGQDVPEAFQGKAEESKAVLRVFPVVEPLGPAPALVDALFGTGTGWFPEVFDTPQGAVIARLAKVQPATAEEWEQLKGIFMAQYKQNRETMSAQAYLTDLRARASIEVSSGALDSITARR